MPPLDRLVHSITCLRGVKQGKHLVNANREATMKAKAIRSSKGAGTVLDKIARVEVGKCFFGRTNQLMLEKYPCEAFVFSKSTGAYSKIAPLESTISR